MTCKEITSTADQVRSTFSSGLGEKIAGFWQAYMEHRAKRATVRILQSLDARTLKDIGVSRGEINSLVYGDGRDRARRYY
jgi:uncharacterized protein YjiS (DUF1127 family)